MKAFDLELVNGRLVTPAGIHQADVGIREGRVAAIGAWGTLPDAYGVIDLTGRVILPGGIDTHVHGGNREPSTSVRSRRPRLWEA